MKYQLNSPVLAVSVLTGAMLAAACGQKPPAAAATSVSDANLTSKIQQARMPADHQDITRYYDLQTHVTERKAARDRELKRGYKRGWAPGDHPAGSGAEGHFDSANGTAAFSVHGFGSSAERHYDRLIERSGGGKPMSITPCPWSTGKWRQASVVVKRRRASRRESTRCESI